jgi:hypothetical protein
MDNQIIENWLKKSLIETIRILNFANNWWPGTAAGQQANASAWAMAFFVEAALDMCAGAQLTARCSEGKKGIVKTIVDDRWVSGANRLHQSSQLMLDFCVTNDGSSDPIQLTGESEVHANHSIGYLPTPDNGYAWDFYKLLIVPSATRLYFARVAAQDGKSVQDRIRELAENLRKLIDLYGPAFVRPNDEIAVVLVPATIKHRNNTRILWVTRGRVRIETVSNQF